MVAKPANSNNAHKTNAMCKFNPTSTEIKGWSLGFLSSNSEFDY